MPRQRLSLSNRKLTSDMRGRTGGTFLPSPSPSSYPFSPFSLPFSPFPFTSLLSHFSSLLSPSSSLLYPSPLSFLPPLFSFLPPTFSLSPFTLSTPTISVKLANTIQLMMIKQYTTFGIISMSSS